MTNDDMTKLTVAELRRSILTHTLISEHVGEINELARRASQAETLQPTLTAAQGELLKLEHLAWNALGQPQGTYSTSNVERLCEKVADLARRAAANEALRTLRSEIEQSRAHSESCRAEFPFGSSCANYWHGCAEADATWLRRVDALLAAAPRAEPVPPAPVQPAAPRDDGVDEAIEALADQLSGNIGVADDDGDFYTDKVFDEALLTVLRLLAARRGGAS